MTLLLLFNGAGAADTHDGGGEDYVRHWKRLREREEEKRRKREEPQEAHLEPVALVAPEPEEPDEPEPPAIDYAGIADKIEAIKVAALKAAADHQRARDERAILAIIENEERKLLQILQEALEDMD